MAVVRFLADMNISPETIRILRLEGWDIVRSSDFLPANAPDQQVLDFARNQARAIVTQDLDFSSLLVSSGYCSPSLVTLRLTVTDPEAVAAALLRALPTVEQRLPQGCAVTIEDASIRIRQLPIA